jgi:hypothetical protein
MFGSSILEVAIGLIFIYLLLSLICSAVNEIIESKLKNRATDLERGIRELFNNVKGDGIVERFYDHSLIRGLYSGTYKVKAEALGNLDYVRSTNLPSYIPAGNFAFAVMDILLHGKDDSAPASENNEAVSGENASQKEVAPVNIAAPGVSWINPYTNTISMESIRFAIDQNIKDEKVQEALRTIVEQSGGDVNLVRQNIEAWFNSSMDRVSGWYTRRTKWIVLVIGLVVTIFLNVNTITIAKRLSSDATLRSMVVAQAEGYANRSNSAELKINFEENRKSLEALGIPMGWNGFKFFPEEFNLWDHILLHLLGWLLTAAAISQGAPFWFDLLNKFMVIRSTVKPHEKSPEESSEDNQRLQPPATTLSSTTETQTLGSDSSATQEAFQPQEWSEGKPQEGIV